MIVPDTAGTAGQRRKWAAAMGVAMLLGAAELPAADAVAAAAEEGRPKAVGYVSANDLAATCRSSEAACVSYTVGVLDAVAVARAAGEHRPLFCVPARTTIGDLGRTVANWLDAHRDMQSSYAAAEMVIRAVTEAHPCKD